MEAYISEETIARCRTMLDALPPRPQPTHSWGQESSRHPQLTQLALLSPEDLPRLETRTKPYSLVNA